MFVDPPVPPSARMPEAPTTHLWPWCSQYPSPKPPVESNTQDRTRLFTGSQPTRWLTSIGSAPLRFTSYSISRKLLFGAHLHLICTVPASSAQSPTIHSSGLSWGYVSEGTSSTSAGRSRALLMRHLLADLTQTAA